MDDITQQAPFIFWCTEIGYPTTQEEPENISEEENYSREGWNT